MVPIPSDEDEWYRNSSTNRSKVESSVYNSQSLILSTDRDYVDVVLRRVTALVEHMETMRQAPDLSDERSQLMSLTARAQSIGIDEAARQTLYNELIALRRQVAFKNPLLDFKDILLVEHDIYTNGSHGTGSHMCDQYYGYNGRKGGGLFLLRDAFTEDAFPDACLLSPIVQNGRLQGDRLLGGSYLSPDLSYDGQTLVFAWAEGVSRVAESGKYQQWNQNTCYHIFKMNIDGSELTQLTDGAYDDFDPVWLPNGRIAFISTRRGGYGRCHGRPVPTYTLHSMNADGSDLITLSWHETNEWHPSVDDNTGMLLYSRWDYLDREDCVAHHLWSCFPDGRDPRARHGNYPLPYTRLSGTGYYSASVDGRKLRPMAELNCRAIPNSQKVVATAIAHHGQSYGSLVILDTRIEDDSQMSQVRRLTPDYPFPEAEYVSGELSTHVYGTAYPLSEHFFLCAYNKSIILLDAFGNREVLHESLSGLRCLDPIPLRTRTAPVLPTFTAQGDNASDAVAKLSIMDVYNSDFPLPEGVEIKEMRIVQVFPKSTPNKDEPRSGYGDESLCRMSLGTVPVEADGSVYCYAPVGKEVYFQLLDANGMAVHSMKSGAYIHPGEHLSCLGCHEDKWQQAYSSTPPVAISRTPSTIEPEMGIVEPMNFHRLIKPILERNCASCHQREGEGPDMSYDSLKDYAWFLHGTAGTGLWGHEYAGSRTIPGKMGAHISRLYTGGYLDEGHHGVSLTTEEKRMITLWLDLNSNEYGALHSLTAQENGELVWPLHDVDTDDPIGTD